MSCGWIKAIHAVAGTDVDVSVFVLGDNFGDITRQSLPGRITSERGALGDWIIQRRCPHLRGDLSRFGETRGSILTCTMHGWQFDLSTGRCLATDDDSYRIRSRPARALAR